MARSSRGVRFVSVLVDSALISAFCILLLVPLPAPAAPRDDLRAAERDFAIAKFGESLAQVTELLEAGSLKGLDRRDAWILKGRCEVKLAHRSDAVDAFCEALKLDAEWAPKPLEFGSDEMAAYEDARSKCNPDLMIPPASQGKPLWKKPWFLGVVGAVAVGGVVLALSGGDEGTEPVPTLSDFPAHP